MLERFGNTKSRGSLNSTLVNNCKTKIAAVQQPPAASLSSALIQVGSNIALPIKMAEGHKHIPVKLGDFSVIDSEFNNIRERFDAEMRKMEDEMGKFRSELMNRESSLFSKSMVTSASQQQDSQGGGSWLEGMKSPLIQQDGDCKQLKLRFDVSQYKPDEIVVKTVDNKLLVHAKHEEKTDNRSVYREYNREFLLPKGTNPESIKSSLSRDGVLTVEAPLPALPEGEKFIAIKQN